jgi:hypothetical protein
MELPIVQFYSLHCTSSHLGPCNLLNNAVWDIVNRSLSLNAGHQGSQIQDNG